MKNYIKAAFISGAAGAITGYILGKYFYFNLREDLSKDMLSCPSSIKYSLGSGSLNYIQNTDDCVTKFKNKLACIRYKEASIQSSINVSKICSSIDKGINYLESKIESTSKKKLIILGESHGGQQSLLFEMAALSYLKKNNLSSNLLAETNSIGSFKYFYLPPFLFDSFLSTNFAVWSLGYKVIGFDPYNSLTPSKIDNAAREASMFDQIVQSVNQSSDEVNIAIVGSTHLTGISKLAKSSPNLKVVILNTKYTNIQTYFSATDSNGKVTVFQDKEKAKEINNIKSIDLIPGVESLSLKQVFDVYDFCINKPTSEEEQVIYSKGVTECHLPNNLDASFNGCDDLTPYEFLCG
jgi:hypothetical protein